MLQMIEVGLAEYIGLPADPNVSKFTEMAEYHESLRTKDAKDKLIHPIALITALLQTGEQMLNLHARLKLSGFERDMGLFIIEHRDQIHAEQSEEVVIKHFKVIYYAVVLYRGISTRTYFFQDAIIDAKMNPKFVQSFSLETLKSLKLSDCAEILSKWTPPKFPISGGDLMAEGVPKGRIISAIMTELKEKWKVSEFELTNEDLIKLIPSVMDNIDMSKFEPKKGSPKSKKKNKHN